MAIISPVCPGLKFVLIPSLKFIRRRLSSSLCFVRRETHCIIDWIIVLQSANNAGETDCNKARIQEDRKWIWDLASEARNS